MNRFSLPIHILSCLLLTMVATSIFSQPVRFYSSDREISNSVITKILQDKQGFIWIATEDGLNRFDGLTFKCYTSIHDDRTTLTSNFVRTLSLDSKGRLWVGCINGLLQYNPEDESFREFPLFRDTIRLQPHISSIIESKNGDMLIATSGYGLVVIKKGADKGYADLELASRLSSEFLDCMFEDLSGKLWIGSVNEGINLFDPVTRQVKIFRHNPQQTNSVSSNYISAICENSKGNILVGTLNGGLNQYDQKTGSFHIVACKSGNKTTLPVKNLFLDSQKTLWVGTDGKGLWKLNPSNGLLEQREIITSSFDMKQSKIHSVTEDNEGNLWLGISQKGVLMIANRPNHFNTYAYQQFGQKSIGSGCIMGISEGADGKIWVGSDTEGLLKIEYHTGNIENHKIISPETETGSISTIYADNEGSLWLGTLMEGLIHLDPATGNTVLYRHIPQNENSLSNDKVQCITNDKQGNIWIGTSGGGVDRLNPFTGKFTHFIHSPVNQDNSICNNWINKIFCDSEGLIWIGTFSRLSVYNPVTNRFRMLSTFNGLLPNNIVFSIMEDSQGLIWIGTNEGLACYNKKTDHSRFYTTKDGLSSNVICDILEDDNNHLWISTHLGLSCFSKSDSSFNNFYVYDGLQGNEFRRNSACKTKNGLLFFGGINGLTWFKPEDIITTSTVPDVYLTNLILFNKAVKIGDKVDNRIILKKSIDETDTLMLSWQDKSFSIEFSIIGYSNPDRYSYQYRLDGFDEKWMTAGPSERRATYTNLGHGKYLFNVKARDKETISKTKKIVVWIMPPWWATKIFKAASLLVILLFLGFIFQYFHSRIRHRQELVRLEHHEKINEAKLQFFTNISHEIRTPLTLIAGPLEKLIAENKDKSLDKNYRIMSQNTHRLLRLVNQLLDIRKIDRGQLLIRFSPVNMVAFISEIMRAFDHLSEKKQISFRFLHDKEDLDVWIDPDNFDKVIYNVLANAFKFTPEKGEIVIRLVTGENDEEKGYLHHYAEISVTDSGPGIDEEETTRIFERFYQIGNHQKVTPGTGIGLHLSKTLTEMQFGTISAENRTDRQGSIFRVRIPLGRAHVTEYERTYQSESSALAGLSTHLPEYIDINDEQEAEISQGRPKTKTRYKILIADDDHEIRKYISAELGDFFRMAHCSNGKKALETILQEKPDLVISDIKMPQMDGITLCRKLKSNPATSHLPVLLLTARTEEEYRNQGLDSGADAYIVKPFNTDHLKRTIFNLLMNRERIKISFSPGGNINAGKTRFSSVDETLLNRIVQIIEDRIADPTFNTEVLSRETGMSRVHLFRKMKQITGQPAGDFIRKFRMQKAAYLLTGNKGFIKEIANETGFTSLSHFSHSFREYYGISPGEYADRNAEKPEKQPDLLNFKQ
jgi:signal transduction histidine kinase/ligand-binding sensor domain-containing protein/DNA-binding NarL/FixJ family response regulator